MPPVDATNTGSTSDINQSQAGAQTGGAQSGAGSAAQAAGAQTGQSQAAAGESAQEAAAHAPIDDSSANLLNLKRLIAEEFNLDALLHQVLATSAQRLARNAEDFDGQVRQLAINSLTLAQQSLGNAVAIANRVQNEAVSDDNRAKDNAQTTDKALDTISLSERERTIRGGDSGDVLRWQSVAQGQLFETYADTIAAKVVAKMASTK